MEIAYEIKKLKSVDVIRFPDDELEFYVHRGHITAAVLEIYLNLVSDYRKKVIR